ncbi:DNA polymerase III subunit delta [bacterium]|nr:DNA polymerase III subunit delta [bacterium]
MTVYFFYGDEDYNIEQAIEKLKQGLDKNFASMNYKVFDNPPFADLMNAIRAQSMMFGKMLTVINCKNYFEKALEDNQLKEIETALENCSQNNDIVFTVTMPRNENKKVDSRKKLFKILSKYNAQEFPTFKLNYYGKQDLSAWIKKKAKEKGTNVGQDVIEALIEQIGNNLREIDMELEKLKLIAYPEKTITTKMVREICISNEDLFNFTELIMSQNYDKALNEYKKLLDKKHPLEILSATQTILRKRILLKLNAHKPINEIVAITGMSDKQIQAVMRNSGKQNLKNLVNLKKKLTQAEYRIKSGLSTDAESEVQNALIR